MEAALGKPAWCQEGKRKGAGCSVLFPEDIFWGVCAMIFSRGCAENLLVWWTQQLMGLSAWLGAGSAGDILSCMVCSGSHSP